MKEQTYTVEPEQADRTLAAFLRIHLTDLSWSKIHRLIENRCVRLNRELYLDPARRLKEGDVVEVLDRPQAKPHEQAPAIIRFLDPHVVVVEKPSGINTVRYVTERNWKRSRKALMPTLEDILPKLIAQRESGNRRPKKGKQSHPRLRAVHRLDKETSGLVVFARTVEAERGLGEQFRAHTVVRRYLALVPGTVQAQRIESRFVRDRGDGRRGSTSLTEQGKIAITHVEVAEKLPGYTMLSCRLETGRTHQIRIHLAELGHPVCGDPVYHHRADGSLAEDRSGAPRLALHATELGFVHPVLGEDRHWSMPMPEDLLAFLGRIRKKRK